MCSFSIQPSTPEKEKRAGVGAVGRLLRLDLQAPKLQRARSWAGNLTAAADGSGGGASNTTVPKYLINDTFWRRPDKGSVVGAAGPLFVCTGNEGTFPLRCSCMSPLHARMMTMPAPHQLFRHGLLQGLKHTVGDKIQILAQSLWPNTFRLDCTVLGQPIGPVTRQKSWEAYMGRPMEQPLRDTCALVACTVAVEAVHRFAYEKVHGEGTFPLRAAVPCGRLIRECYFDGIWTPGKGAYVGAVLTNIHMGGVPATADGRPTPAPCVLPLRSWQKHRWDAAGDSGTRRLTPKRVAKLLESHGPCVGVLWVCPWYVEFDAGVDDTLVYRGCGRSEDDRRESWRLYSGKGVVGSHAVVVFAYRSFGDRHMHVLVRDNHDAAANGPNRWIDVGELDTLYTLTVQDIRRKGVRNNICARLLCARCPQP